MISSVLPRAGVESGFKPLITFGGKGKQARQVEEEVNQQVKQFKTELKALVQWDKETHQQPVFQKVKIAPLVELAKSFLLRQTENYRIPNPFLIGVAGGSASGKTYSKQMLKDLFPVVAQEEVGWKAAVNGPIVDDLELDSYYRDFSGRRKELGDVRYFQETNLDEPAALHMNQARKDVMRVRNGVAIRSPLFDYRNSQRHDGVALKVPSPFFLIEGLFALVPEKLRQLYDMKIFVQADKDVRTQRFWERAASRNVTPANGGQALYDRVMEMHDQHVQPSSKNADIIINGNSGSDSLRESLTRLTQLLVRTFYPPKAKSQVNQA